MLKINNIYKSFGTLEVLKGIDLSVEEGEVIALIGPSGTGKSTLLRCINLIEMPEAGTIELDGFMIDVQTASRDDILKLRAKTSMVFQNYNLFKNKTVLQNVMLPFLIRKEMDKSQAEAEAIELLDKVGPVSYTHLTLPTNREGVLFADLSSQKKQKAIRKM